MTTFGPSTMTLGERLLGADLVARVVDATLVSTTTDEQSESRREHGTFVFTVAQTLRGEPVETVEVLVARAPDDPWPVPEKGEFLALLQAGGDRRWVLVHDSAFPLRGTDVRVDPGAGLTSKGAKPQKVTLDEVIIAIAEQEKRAASYSATLEGRERTQFESGGRPVQEVPGDGLREWLDLEHGEGGRLGEPSTLPDQTKGPARGAD